MLTMEHTPEVTAQPTAESVPLSVEQVRAILPNGGKDAQYTDQFCCGLAEYAHRNGLRLTARRYEVMAAPRLTAGPDGSVVGIWVYQVTAGGLATLAKRADILEGTHEVTRTGPLVATARVYQRLPTGDYSAVDATAVYEDWYDRNYEAPLPAPGALAPIWPGRWQTDPEGALIGIARSLAYRAALGRRLAGQFTYVDVSRSEQHRLYAAMLAQAAQHRGLLQRVGVTAIQEMS